MKNYNSFNAAIYKNNKINFIAAIFFTILIAITDVGLAIFLQMVIDIGIGSNIDILIKIIFAGIGLLVASMSVGILGNRLQNRYLKRALCNIKSELINKVICMKLRDFKKNNSGNYISMLNNNIKVIETDYIKGSIDIIAQAMMVFFGVCVMLFINYKMTICVLLLCLIPVGISVASGNKLKRYQGEVSDNNCIYTTLIKDVFSGITVIKSFSIEKEIMEMTNNRNDKLETKKMKFANLFGLVTNLGISSSFLIVIVIFLYGAWLTIKGEMTVGSILAVVQLLNNVTAPIGKIAEAAAKKRASISLVKGMEEVLKIERPVENKKGKLDFNSKISINNVTFSHDCDSDPILKNVNFEFEKGKSYAIVGISGSGKSTLLNLLAGYYDQYVGNIYVDETELRDIDESSMYLLFSIVQQESFMFDNTIEENVKLFKKWPEEKIHWAVHQSGLDEFIELRGINSLCGENGNLLSGGEKQRISIARALLSGSPVLLLDEATASLDMHTTYEVEKSISEIEGITKIVITHKLDSKLLEKYDSILMMKDGEIIEAGTYKELIDLQSEFYSLCKLNDVM